MCVFLFVEIDIIFGGARFDVATYGGQSNHEGAICKQAYSNYFSFEQGAFVAKWSILPITEDACKGDAEPSHWMNKR